MQWRPLLDAEAIIVAEEWRPAYHTTALHNTLLLRALEEALARLTAEGIEVIVLKGAALILTVYPNLGLRPMSDVDILVRPTDLLGAIKVLEDLGYVAAPHQISPTDALANACEVVLTRSGEMGAMIEVHWTLLNLAHHQRRLPLDWFWRTARPLQVGEQQALQLGPEAQILYLCGHLCLHHWQVADSDQRWLNDIALCIEHDEGSIDWDVALALAQRCDLVMPLQRALPRAAAEWDAPVPSEVLAAVRRLKPSPEEERVFHVLRSVGLRLWTDTAALAGWRQRLQFALSNLFPSPAYMRQRYGIVHPVLTPLYYPYRWWLGIRSACGL